VAVRTRYPARPRRRVIVVTDLDSLRGPARGTVGLPLRLYWSGPSPVFDLACRTCGAGRIRSCCGRPAARRT
jgi:hypothetical protein